MGRVRQEVLDGIIRRIIEACRTLGPVRLLLFDLRVMADTFGILAKGQGL